MQKLNNYITKSNFIIVARLFRRPNELPLTLAHDFQFMSKYNHLVINNNSNYTDKQLITEINQILPDLKTPAYELRQD